MGEIFALSGSCIHGILALNTWFAKCLMLQKCELWHHFVPVADDETLWNKKIVSPK